MNKLLICVLVFSSMGCFDTTNNRKLHISAGVQRAWRSHEGVGDGIVLTRGDEFLRNGRAQISYAYTQYEDENVHRIGVEIFDIWDDDKFEVSFLLGLAGHASESGDWGGGIVLGAGLTKGMKRKNPGFIIMPTLYTWIGQYDYEWELRTEGAVKIECCWLF